MILAIDPGTKESGWVRFDGDCILESGLSPNADLLARLRIVGGYIANGLHMPMALAIERFEARGMPIGDESVQTILWTGRFVQAWHKPDEVVMVKRSAVKLHLCGTTRAKDGNIRAALIDALGPRGTKKAPGGTYGVSSHAWAALGVAVTALAQADLLGAAA